MCKHRGRKIQYLDDYKEDEDFVALSRRGCSALEGANLDLLLQDRDRTLRINHKIFHISGNHSLFEQFGELLLTSKRGMLLLCFSCPHTHTHTHTS